MSTAKEWLVRLKGDRLDLLALSRSFRSNDISVAEENGVFYLKSSRFRSLTDANDVAELAMRIVPLLGFATNAVSRGNPAISADSVISIDPCGDRSLALIGIPVWAWGGNDSGQLGIPVAGLESVPTRLLALGSGAFQVAAGGGHSLALRGDGTVVSWGDNLYGELGIGTMTASPVITPVQVIDPADSSGLLTNIEAIAAGLAHSLALKGDGTVWAWGLNENGALGDGTRDNRLSPVQVPGLANVVLIAAGGFHSLAARADGAVFAWGYNYTGQLGIGLFTVDSLVPVQVVGPQGSGFFADCKALGAGLLHSLAVRASDGAVFCWGANQFGQLGIGTFIGQTFPVRTGLDAINEVDAGRDHSLALRSDGTVFAWGSNEFGQLGSGTRGAGQAFPVQIAGLDGAYAIAAGHSHCFAAVAVGFGTSTGSAPLFAWGRNSSGQLGDGTVDDRAVPVQSYIGGVPFPVVVAGSNIRFRPVAGGGRHSLALTGTFLF